MNWFEDGAVLAQTLNAARQAAGGVTLVLADPWLHREVRLRDPVGHEDTGRLWLGLDPGDIGTALLDELLQVLLQEEGRARNLAEVIERKLDGEVLDQGEANSLGLTIDDSLLADLIMQYRLPSADQLGPSPYVAALVAVARERIQDFEARYTEVGQRLLDAVTQRLLVPIQELAHMDPPIEVIAVGGAGVCLPVLLGQDPSVSCIAIDPHVTAGALERVAQEGNVVRLRTLVLSAEEPRAFRAGDQVAPGVSPTRGVAAAVWDALVHGPGPGRREDRFAGLSTPDTLSPRFVRAMLPIEGRIDAVTAADVFRDRGFVPFLDDLRAIGEEWDPDRLNEALDVEMFDVDGPTRRRRELWDAWMDTDHALTWQLARPAELVDAPASDHWRAAAARVDVTRELFRNPAGYAYTKSRSASGLMGPILAKVCLLEDPQGERVLLVSLDAIAGSRFIAEKLGQTLADLGLSVDRVFLGATHTHSAPGDVIGSLFYDTFADTLWQGFDPQGAFFICSRIEAEVRHLVGQLEEVTLRRVDGAVRGKLLWQRSPDAFVAEVGEPWDVNGAVEGAAFLATLGLDPPRPSQGLEYDAVDPRLRGLVLERLDGSVLFAMVPVGATGTLCAPHTALYTGDIYGAAGRAAELALADAEHSPVIALVAGAHGDTNMVDPEVGVHTLRSTRTKEVGSTATRRRVALRWVRRVGEALGADVAAAINSRKPLEADRLELWFAEALVPRAQVDWRVWGHRVPTGVTQPTRPRHLASVWGFGESTTQASEMNVPPGNEKERSYNIRKQHAATGTRLNLRQPPVWWRARGPSWSPLSSVKAAVPFAVAGDLGYCPFTAFRILRLGPIAFLGIPSEPSTRLSKRVEESVAQALEVDPKGVIMTGGTGGMQGYADTVGAALVEDYEGSSMYWGRDYGVWIEAELQRLAKAVMYQPTNNMAPGPAAWIQGGKVGRGERATGSAAFTLRRGRMGAYGAVTPQPDLGQPMRAEPRQAAIASLAPLHELVQGIPPYRGLEVAGWWEPARPAEKRRAQDQISWPRPGDQGPFVQIVVLPSSGEPERVLLDSQFDPVLVVWATEGEEVWLPATPLPAWCFQAEIAEDGLAGRTLGFRVRGQGYLHPNAPADGAAVTVSGVLATMQVP